ncbi:unnamed protein product [Blepharisma stoltei]|uniref:Integral membrane protein n=1 Tax=Blepharisma stoltei TaxID=1481888 RepID=A0AAU9ITR4_9CILI|nr:unnamed protein product [Blepharisma stoltei]
MKSLNSNHHRQFRLFMGLYTFAFFLIGIHAVSYRYLQWLTHWGVTLTLSFFFLKLANKHRQADLVYQIVLPIEATLTFTYWSFVFPSYTLEQRPPLIYNISVHILQFLFLMFDFSYNKIQFHRKNMIFPIVLMMLYGLLNFIVTMIDEPIYPTLTFTDIKSLLFMIFACVMLVCAFELCILISRSKAKSEIKEKADKL